MPGIAADFEIAMPDLLDSADLRKLDEQSRGDFSELAIAVLVALFLVAWWLNETNRTGQVITETNRADLTFKSIEIAGLARGSAYLAAKLLRKLP